jgi:DNA-binding MurR/RpiR family transcriptional regulator
MRPKSITVSEPKETERLIAFANRHGLKKAAKKYGTSPASLSRWIRTQGFEMVREYRRKAVQS